MNARGAGLSDCLLECGLVACCFGVLREEIVAVHLSVSRIAEVEEGAASHLGVVEHALEDFELRNALAG